MSTKSTKNIVVIGNGMVGHRFCDRLVEFDEKRDFHLVVFGEEPRPVYDRVHLTRWFTHRDPAKLRKDAEHIYMHRHMGITVETLCMMLTDYQSAVRKTQ